LFGTGTKRDTVSMIYTAISGLLTSGFRLLTTFPIFADI
jgi:hypothetical protein